jgi:hypothetical protein
VTREEMARQLDVLKSHGRVVQSVGIPVVFLLDVIIIVWFFRVQHAQARSGLLGTVFFAAIVGAFYLVTRHIVAKYAPLCPFCAKPISWRERDSALRSGSCPHCKRQIFLPSGQTERLE